MTNKWTKRYSTQELGSREWNNVISLQWIWGDKEGLWTTDGSLTGKATVENDQLAAARQILISSSPEILILSVHLKELSHMCLADTSKNIYGSICLS